MTTAEEARAPVWEAEVPWVVLYLREDIQDLRSEVREVRRSVQHLDEKLDGGLERLDAKIDGLRQDRGARLEDGGTAPLDHRHRHRGRADNDGCLCLDRGSDADAVAEVRIRLWCYNLYQTIEHQFLLKAVTEKSRRREAAREAASWTESPARGSPPKFAPEPTREMANSQ